MKTNFKIIIVVVTIAFVAVSCGKGSSVDSALSQIEKAMDKVEKNKTSMTTADWEALNAELEQPAKVLSDALDDNQVGTLKKLKITAVMLRYATVTGEAALHTVTDSLKVKMEETHLADSIAVAIDKMQDVLKSDEIKQAGQKLLEMAEEISTVEN